MSSIVYYNAPLDFITPRDDFHVINISFEDDEITTGYENDVLRGGADGGEDMFTNNEDISTCGEEDEVLIDVDESDTNSLKVKVNWYDTFSFVTRHFDFLRDFFKYTKERSPPN
ncbi:MAG: hypothetical protein QNJ55_22465 [Xenococcus sp. MO_188.B8]|nr:hypothetical protein [Xenococcus sp. MO_188.B8]